MKELTKELKVTIGLLSTGTFLEYFDLMLYVHMAVLLNGLFYEATDPHSMALAAAFGFSITFCFRPIGAYAFGWIGDNFGRKPIIIITTIMMALSCFIIAVLPTYAEIGYGASIGLTLCRILQSISSTGEVTSCDLYLMESTEPPIQYPISGITSLFAVLGGTAALGIASLVTTQGFNWRYAFWIGTTIAIIGLFTRINLKDTREFSNIQERIKETAKKLDLSFEKAKEILNINETKVSNKTIVALIIIECMFPIYYYFSYIHCGELFKNLFDYSTADVIHHNFVLSISDIGRVVFLMWISYYIHPLKILKIQLILSAIFAISCPFLLNYVTTSYHLSFIQYGMLLFSIHGLPAFPVFYKHIPILQRFRWAGLPYALGRAIMFVISSYGIVYLIDWFGNLGLLFLFLPALALYTIALYYFINLEKKKTLDNQSIVGSGVS
jgi:MFS family permease